MPRRPRRVPYPPGSVAAGLSRRPRGRSLGSDARLLRRLGWARTPCVCRLQSPRCSVYVTSRGVRLLKRLGRLGADLGLPPRVSKQPMRRHLKQRSASQAPRTAGRSPWSAASGLRAAPTRRHLQQWSASQAPRTAGRSPWSAASGVRAAPTRRHLQQWSASQAPRTAGRSPWSAATGLRRSPVDVTCGSLPASQKLRWACTPLICRLGVAQLPQPLKPESVFTRSRGPDADSPSVVRLSFPLPDRRDPVSGPPFPELAPTSPLAGRSSCASRGAAGSGQTRWSCDVGPQIDSAASEHE